jgi:hypothetical protein
MAVQRTKHLIPNHVVGQRSTTAAKLEGKSEEGMGKGGSRFLGWDFYKKTGHFCCGLGRGALLSVRGRGVPALDFVAASPSVLCHWSAFAAAATAVLTGSPWHPLHCLQLTLEGLFD